MEASTGSKANESHDLEEIHVSNSSDDDINDDSYGDLNSLEASMP